MKTQVSMVKGAETSDKACREFELRWKGLVDRVRIYDEHSKDGDFGSLMKPRLIRQPCVMPSYEMLIYDDGIIARCNHDWDSDGMGDITKSSLKEIWMSQKYIDLRNQHVTQNLTDPVCSKCDSWYPEIGNQGTGGVVENG